jgi:hypothetical protein
MKKLYDTPIKAMRKKCIDCTAGSHKEIRLCTIVECAIYPYRFGRRPNKAVVDTLKRFHAENVEPTGGF